MKSHDQRGFTLIELLIVVGLIGILAAIASASMMQARISANESSAIASLRSIISAQIDYGSVSRGYADDLASLATACPGSPITYLSGDLGANGVTKSGYIYSAAAGAGAIAGPNDCNGAGTQSAFYVMAAPISIGRSGNRAFASNTSSALWQDTSGIAPAEPFATGGTISPIAQ